VLLAAVAAVRRPEGRHAQAVTWMSLLVLASLQSPFAPGYTLIALLWAITLLAVEVRTLRGGVALVTLGLVLVVSPPWLSVSGLAVQSIVQSTLAVVVPAGLILRAARGPVA
jgi:hypothetical protein